jgi:diguanylate cyclase (GGDEF)-like protein
MALTFRRMRRGSGAGTPLWLYLTALVLVPLVGVAVLTVAGARTQMAEAASAARAEAAVRAVAQLDAARSGVEHEVIPVLSIAVIQDPATADALGLNSFLGRAQLKQTVDSVRRTRTATDRALAQVPADSVGAEAARTAAASLAALRTEADAGDADLVHIYTTYLQISERLTIAQRQAAVAAGSVDSPIRTLRAARDVQLVAQLAQTASRQMPLFLGSRLSRFASIQQFSEFSTSFLLGEDGTPIDLQKAWEAAWLDYTDALRQMDRLSQSSLRAAWGAVHRSEAMSVMDDVLIQYADGAGAPEMSVLQLVLVLAQNADRDAALTELLNTSVQNAQTLAATDRAQAEDRRTTTSLLGIGLLVASVLGALALGRSVSRSLRLLSGQATQVSEGSLVEVAVTGPREVRTVSTALGAAVASLRRIQDQAQAVARGDLSNTVLDEPLPGPLGEVVHASVREIVNSVRQREELQFALAHQATHDPLTELPNRAQALTLVTSALHRALRSGEMTGLLFVDLDGFKAVNDSHGHANGDVVLQEVARRLRAAVRPGDEVCRLGGDEFVVLVEQVQGERDLLDLADRLIAAVSEPMTAGGHPVRIGASVGVAVSRDGGADADALFAEADTAAYRAKGHGRGRAEIFDEHLRAQLNVRAELEAAIAHGLAEGEMQLHYQPVMDVGTDRLMGYEALVRWQRPGHGTVPPDQFIPVAEGSRLICDVDRWVLHEATRQLAAWRAEAPAAPGEPEPTIAVNISGRHLADRRVVSDVADALAASGLPAQLLVVEVTETVLVNGPVAIDHLAELRAMGVAIAIDDFGTGYTSIGQLGNMPVDTLKIDRSFIASSEPGHRELVALMIRAAHTFGLTVVAEGVEEPAQLAELRAQSCDQAQGYLLCRPLPAADVAALMRPLSSAAPV